MIPAPSEIFVFKGDPFGHSQFSRRTSKQLSANDSTLINVASAEDTILAKLQWYRDCGGVSDRQWNDVLGVLKVQGSTLDRAYLDEWARELGITDLLRQAVDEAGLAPGSGG